jgi:serine/threonine protein kinase
MYAREIHFFETLKHKYIARFLDHVEEGCDGFIILEPTTYGTLADLERVEKFTARNVNNICR